MKQKWISVKKSVPDISSSGYREPKVLVKCEYGQVVACRIGLGFWEMYLEGIRIPLNHVTHWMRLPANPRMKVDTIEFTPFRVKEYLGKSIDHWRKVMGDSSWKTREKLLARCYVDAYQSVYSSLFGELYPKARSNG